MMQKNLKETTPPAEQLRTASYSGSFGVVRKFNAGLRYYRRDYGEVLRVSPSKRYVVVPKIVRASSARRARLPRAFFVDIPEPRLDGRLPPFRRTRDVFYETFRIEAHFLGNTDVVFVQTTAFLRLFPKFRIMSHDVFRTDGYKKIPQALPDRILLEDLAGVVGFEPTSGGFRIRCLNRTWRYPSPDMVRSERLELS